MVRDECGGYIRAHGDEYLERVFEFPMYDERDLAMVNAFESWRDTIEATANEIWQRMFGDECRVFLEIKYSELSASDAHNYLETTYDWFQMI